MKNSKLIYYLMALQVIKLNLMAVTLCVGMQPVTLCVTHYWSDAGYSGTRLG
jgi:hypothetical protein